MLARTLLSCAVIATLAGCAWLRSADGDAAAPARLHNEVVDDVPALQRMRPPGDTDAHFSQGASLTAYNG